MSNIYTKKRNFKLTPEPQFKKGGPSIEPHFVIQEHHASHLHYDFRLEIEGVLKSWAVPKGVPESPTEKRLAVPTEDHPLAYENFEGTIPKGEYGGGKVIIWDKGTYKNLTYTKNNTLKPLKKALKDGHILVKLHGKKLNKQCFALHRFRKGKKDLWLLMKVKDG